MARHFWNWHFLLESCSVCVTASIWNEASLWQGAVLNVPNVLDFVHCHIILYTSHTHKYICIYIYLFIYIYTHIYKYSSLLSIHIRPPVCSTQHNHPAICVPRARAMFIGRLHKLITVIRGISPICNFALPRRSCVMSHMLKVLQHCVLGTHLVFTGTFVSRQHVRLPGRASPWCSEGCRWDGTEGNMRSSRLAVGL